MQSTETARETPKSRDGASAADRQTSATGGTTIPRKSDYGDQDIGDLAEESGVGAEGDDVTKRNNVDQQRPA